MTEFGAVVPSVTDHRGRAGKWRERSTPAVLIAIVVISVALATAFGSDVVRLNVTEDVILLMAAVAFYIFAGNSGVFAFGQVAFMTIGAYAGSLVSMPPDVKASAVPGLPSAVGSLHLNPYLGCLVGGLVAAVAAGVLAVPLMRLSGLAAALTSFAVLEIVLVIAREWRSLTNGELGIPGIPTTIGLWGTVGIASASLVAAFSFQQSRWGARLRASREDEIAARSLGIGVINERRSGFVISAFVMGVAGTLYAQFLGAVTPETFYITTTFLVVVIMIVGGQNTLSGCVVGCLFVSAVRECLRLFETGIHISGLSIKGPVGLQQVGLAACLVVTLIARPAGLTGGREIVFGRPTRWRWASASSGELAGSTGESSERRPS